MWLPLKCILHQDGNLVGVQQERNSTLIFRLDGYVTFSKAQVKIKKGTKTTKCLQELLLGMGL